MSADALREVARLPFVEIGSHTNTHADLSAATEDEAYRELSSSRRALEDLLNLRVTSLAYPFCHYSAACPRAAKRRLHLRGHLRGARWMAPVRATTRGDRGLGRAPLVRSEVPGRRSHGSSLPRRTVALRLRRGVAKRKLQAK